MSMTAQSALLAEFRAWLEAVRSNQLTSTSDRKAFNDTVAKLIEAEACIKALEEQEASDA